MTPEQHAENLWWLLGIVSKSEYKWISLEELPFPPNPETPEWVFRHWAHDNLVKVVRPFVPQKSIYWAREEGLLLGVRDSI